MQHYENKSFECAMVVNHPVDTIEAPAFAPKVKKRITRPAGGAPRWLHRAFGHYCFFFVVLSLNAHFPLHTASYRPDPSTQPAQLLIPGRFFSLCLTVSCLLCSQKGPLSDVHSTFLLLISSFHLLL